jgi:hypothetical protein
VELTVILDAFERLGGMEARRIAEGRWLYPNKETRRTLLRGMRAALWRAWEH